MPETSQPFPSRNAFDAVKVNSDNSVDLYFGPTKPRGITLKRIGFRRCPITASA
jgi:hypothetical protein